LLRVFFSSSFVTCFPGLLSSFSPPFKEQFLTKKLLTERTITITWAIEKKHQIDAYSWRFGVIYPANQGPVRNKKVPKINGYFLFHSKIARYGANIKKEWSAVPGT